MPIFKYYFILAMIVFGLPMSSGGLLGLPTPENNQGGLEGMVTSESGLKIQDVKITFVKEDGSVTKSEISNNNGFYHLSLNAGRYWITATHPDYEDYSSFPDFFEVEGDYYQTRDVILREPRVTTVLLTRHADRANDYLSEPGWVRAIKLAHVACKAGVTAIYRSNTNRTLQTVQPLADFLDLEPIIENNVNELVSGEENGILSAHNGDVVLVASHSGGFAGHTVPNIIKELGGIDCEGSVYEYDNLFVVTCGPGDTNVVNLQYGQPDSPQPPYPPDGVVCSNQMTTLLLVRHVEDGEAGNRRAEKLAHVAVKAGVTAIYATDDSPTWETVQDLVGVLENIEQANSYDSDNIQEFVDNLLSNHTGEAVVVAGSNNILSEIIEELGGSPLPSLFENEYDNLFVITVYEPDEPREAKVVNLQYGDPSPHKHVSVVHIIDRTGSMGTYEYMEPAKIATKNFIGLMQKGDEVGVVAFDDLGCDGVGTKAEAIFNLAEITSAAVKINAISSVNPLYERGCTSIGAGMQLAQEGPNFLDAATDDQPHAMVLLTDGFENTSPWVDDVLPNIPDETDIYTIALGSTADSDLMKDIANTTGGKFYESPTILGLLSIYYQIQGDLELGDMADLATGTKSSGNDTRSVTIDYGTGEATFVVGWLQKEGRLKLTLKDPLGVTITASSPNVKTGNGPTYYYLKIKNPLPGDWQVHIIRTDSAAFEIDYTFAAFVKGVSKLWSFIPYFTFADDCLLTKVHLYDSRTLQPITGASIKALIFSPHTSKYTLHYNYVKPGVSGWKPKAVMSSKLIRAHSVSIDSAYDQLPKWVTTLQFYNQQSLKETGQSIFQYDTTEVILYDDGTHGDEEVEDGNYTNCIDESKVAGSHSITFSISGVDQSGSNFTRKLVSTASIMPGKIDPVKTLVRVEPSRIDVAEGSEATITIVPMDGFGNVWGPGYASRISVSTTAGTLVGDIKDNGDGFYFQTISSTGTQGIGKVTVVVDDVEMRSKPSLMIGLGYRFSVSIHSGTAFPTGTFATDFDPGFNVLLDVDYHFSPQFSLVGFFGYNAFESKITGIDATYWINLSANVRYQRLLTIPFSYYIGAGPGIYIPKDGDTEFGVNAGCGLNYEFHPRIAFELGADYHWIFDPDVQFTHSHAGLVFRF